MPDPPARQPAGGEGMHDRHPEPAEHGAQIWVERVTDDPKSVTVFIEDGSSTQESGQ